MLYGASTGFNKYIDRQNHKTSGRRDEILRFYSALEMMLPLSEQTALSLSALKATPSGGGNATFKGWGVRDSIRVVKKYIFPLKMAHGNCSANAMKDGQMSTGSIHPVMRSCPAKKWLEKHQKLSHHTTLGAIKAR